MQKIRGRDIKVHEALFEDRPKRDMLHLRTSANVIFESRDSLEQQQKNQTERLQQIEQQYEEFELKQINSKTYKEEESENILKELA